MIRSIIKDPLLLNQKAKPCRKEDLYLVPILKETLLAHQEECVGMAGNMIGENKQVIIIKDDQKMVVMFNPEIIKHSKKTYQAQEGCLSLPGQIHEVTRYEVIKVAYYDEHWNKKIKTYKDFTAEIIQHEMDHLQGIVV